VNGSRQHSPHWLQLPVRWLSTGSNEVRVRVSFGNISSLSNAVWRYVKNPGRWVEERLSLHNRETAGDIVRGCAPAMALVGRRVVFHAAPVPRHYTPKSHSGKRRGTTVDFFPVRARACSCRLTRASSCPPDGGWGRVGRLDLGVSIRHPTGRIGLD
jgi:hypothetical protein